MGTVGIWTGFFALVLAALALDLFVVNRKAREISIRQSLGWVCFWISLAMLFNVAVYSLYQYHYCGLGTEAGKPLNGWEAAVLFFTAYVVEYSLSVDNLFVFAIIFMYFGIPPKYQHRALFWGILGAIILRGTMIVAGTVLVHRFEWILYVFGAILVLTAVKLFFSDEEKYDPGKNLCIRATKRMFPVTNELDGERFFSRLNGKFAVTPLFIVLLALDFADVVFAVDSIPAVFAITTDTFLAFTSNIFAILGLRMLYFALAGLFGLFHYLKISLVFVLGFVGVKMLIAWFWNITPLLSLAIILAILLTGIVASVVKQRREIARTPLEKSKANNAQE